MSNENYRKEIEEDILQIIEEKLTAGEMIAERAREIAKYILENLHPSVCMEQIHSVVQDFDEHFAELVPIVTYVSLEYEDRIKKAVAEHAGNLYLSGEKCMKR